MDKPFVEENTYKVCRTCNKKKHVGEFPKTTNKRFSYCRPDCYKCHSTYTYRSYLEKKIQAYPDKYHECGDDDCNWIWAKRRGSNCPKCKGPSI